MKEQKVIFGWIGTIALMMPMGLFILGIYVFLNYGYGAERAQGLETWKQFRNMAYFVYIGLLAISAVYKKAINRSYVSLIVVGILVSTFSYALAGLLIDLINLGGYVVIRAPVIQIPR